MGMQDRVGLQGAEQRKGEGGWKEPQDTGVREGLSGGYERLYPWGPPGT